MDSDEFDDDIADEDLIAASQAPVTTAPSHGRSANIQAPASRYRASPAQANPVVRISFFRMT